MSLNSTPSGERIHIGIFGKRNVGKSSLINAMTGQKLSIVSDVEGTTTDPVQKAMELLPLGPVVLIDTPGIDDVGELGSLRVKRSYQMLNKSDLGLLVVDGREGMTAEDEQLFCRMAEKQIPCLVVLNRCDMLSKKETENMVEKTRKCLEHLYSGKIPQTAAVSAATGWQIQELKERLTDLVPKEQEHRRLVADLLDTEKLTVLVVPIDKAAPKGRLILPQQQTIRDILEAGGAVVTVRDTELKETLEKLEGQVGMVITDSQVFGQVAPLVPEKIPLTSFSILFARYKGELQPLLSGVKAVEQLKDRDRVLISEGCTHHRQCNDIGTVKIPGWLRRHTGKELEITFTSGGEFPEDLSSYSLVVHCGGCMLNAREMRYRIACAVDAGIPITNYGMLISYFKGTLARSLSPVLKERNGQRPK
ncbi:MAG: [FeFe] hydrogenase H-cluster maturation GTPase HydF [Clostridiales bacterium]|nr:[FeFe] hydrogenase H-cluster maturation GTPase HydF [Clostridiales bacterium]